MWETDFSRLNTDRHVSRETFLSSPVPRPHMNGTLKIPLTLIILNLSGEATHAGTIIQRHFPDFFWSEFLILGSRFLPEFHKSSLTVFFRNIQNTGNLDSFRNGHTAESTELQDLSYYPYQITYKTLPPSLFLPSSFIIDFDYHSDTIIKIQDIFHDFLSEFLI